MNQKTSLTIIVVLALIIGFLGGYWSYSATEGSSTSKCPSEQEIKENFVEKLRDEGIVPAVPKSITSARGKITQVRENSVVIKTDIPNFDPLQKYLEPTLTVKITDNTELLKKLYESSEDTPASEIKFSDLTKGQVVTVYSNQGFKGKTNLEAQGIVIVELPSE